MSYGNRSKEYDWFKGGNQEKKSPKSTLKTIWRFTKIFLMFSLFFFSMWGCVQVFIIKTDTSVGNGVEFYNSEDEIAPHVRQFKLTKDAKGIYTLNADGENVWLNKDQTPAELSGVQKVLKKDAAGKETIKLSETFKGTNEYARFLNEDGTLLVPTNKYLAVSTQQTKYQGATAPRVANVVIGTVDPGTVTYAVPALPSGSVTASAEQARIDYQRALLNVVNEQLKAKADYLAADWNWTDAANKNRPNVNEEKVAHSKTWDSIFTYLGVSAAKPVSGKSTFTFNPGILTGTHYRPILTWGQAWTRGVGPFYGLFVWPIAKMGVAITNGLGVHSGWGSLFSIVIIVFILRILAFGLTFKSVLQQTKQQEVQAKKAIIDAKYESYKGNKQMEQRKRQETSELYKKEGISPLGALGTMFITMPIFLSIWRVIGGVPHLKATVWLGINFSATSYKELFAGEWQYLPLLIIAAASAAFSQLYPRLLTKRRDKNRINVHQKAAMKKNNKTQNIILIVYMIMAVIFSAGIQIYWVVGGIWQIIQATITHHVLIKSRKRAKNRVKV